MGYQELYESLKTAYAELERRYGLLVTENDAFRMEKKSWEIEKMNQAQIIQQALSGVNAQTQEVLEENQRLKEELRVLRG